jgi:hypothetical protein
MARSFHRRVQTLRRWQRVQSLHDRPQVLIHHLAVAHERVAQPAFFRRADLPERAVLFDV